MKKEDNAKFNISDIGKIVTLHGWVLKKRDLGGLIFIDLRDRSGIIQVVVKPENPFYELASTVKSEYVIKVTGSIVKRESINTKIPTGEVEVIVDNFIIINEASELPFELGTNASSLEETRLKYRYLDIRRDNIKNNLILSHKLKQYIRNYLSDLSFVEVDTPILSKSTPEGARDYLVPSRIHKGSFYALPQSPQIYKQLLMIGGMERYFQIARCFRDEDLRADRQPEFTQVDIEMSFAEEEDVRNTVEGLFKGIWKKFKNIELDKFQVLTYKEAMDKYGSDKPDLRFNSEFHLLNNIFNNTEFNIYQEIINNNQSIIGFKINGNLSRKEIDKYQEYIKANYKINILSYLKYNDTTLSGSLLKVLSESEQKSIIKEFELNNDEMIFILAGDNLNTKKALGSLRLKVANDLGLINNKEDKFAWIVDFPMYEYSAENNMYVSAHHPFTAPKDEHIDKLIDDKENCLSKAYDLVCNGYELLSGSIRIHNSATQKKVFEALGLSDKDIKEKFGFFVDAFNYGTPPHGGVGIGLERLIMILAGTDNIRDVVAFPKTTQAYDLMCDAPGNVSLEQLKELSINISK